MGFELKKTTDVIANFLTLLRKCGDVFVLTIFYDRCEVGVGHVA